MKPRRKKMTDQAEPGYALRPASPGRKPTEAEEFSLLDQQLRDRYRDTPMLLQPHELPAGLQPLAPDRRAALLTAEQRSLVRFGSLASQEQQRAAAWEQAIDALPPPLRDGIAEAARLLDEVERDLADKRTRLGNVPRDTTDLWVARRITLSGQIDALEDLLIERRAEYQRLCADAGEQLRQIAHDQAEQAGRSVEQAEQHYESLLAEAKARVAQLRSEQQALATVAAEATDPATVERCFGPVVTAQPDLVAVRKAERAERRSIAARLVGALR
jgi:chromosome segregation ATPase